MIFRAIRGHGLDQICDLCPPRLCPECKGEHKALSQCGRCNDLGTVPILARWSIEYAGGTIAFLCEVHSKAAGTFWECPKCVQNNSGPRCSKCFYAKPNDCAKCGRHVGDASSGCKGVGGVSLVKLVSDNCISCHGTGRLSCSECLGGGLCKTCDGQGEIDGGDCSVCNRSGSCNRCDGQTLNPKFWGVAAVPDRSIARDPELECSECGGEGRLRHKDMGPWRDRVRNQETQGFTRRVFINDIPQKYHSELEAFVDCFICWVCALPDMVISPYDGRQRTCLQPDCEQVLSGYNIGAFCWAHTSNHHCPECNIKLSLDETGLYCKTHEKCAKCGDPVEPWSIFCSEHHDIRGFGVLHEKGGFGKQSSASPSGYSKVVTAKPGKPDSFLARIEKLARLKHQLERRLARSHEEAMRKQERVIDIRKKLEGFEKQVEEGSNEAELLRVQVQAMEVAKVPMLELDREREKLSVVQERLLALRTELAIQSKPLPGLEDELEVAQTTVCRTADILSILPYSVQHLQDAFQGWKYDPWIRVDRPRPEPVETVLEPYARCEKCAQRFSDLGEVHLHGPAMASEAEQKRSLAQETARAQQAMRRSRIWKASSHQERARLESEAIRNATKSVKGHYFEMAKAIAESTRYLCSGCRYPSIPNKHAQESRQFLRDMLAREAAAWTESIQGIKDRSEREVKERYEDIRRSIY